MNLKQAFSRYDEGAEINAFTNILKKRKMNPKNAEWIMIIIVIAIVFLIVRFIVIPLNQWMKRNKKK